MRTRYAPTPSGYLHEGNLAHLLAVQRMAEFLDADIALRIDDIDADRTDQVYVEDIFDALDWLELLWSWGPQTAHDLDTWSQSSRIEHYQAALRSLVEHHVVYRCSCSRRDWDGYRGKDCPRTCRTVGAAATDASWRLHLPDLIDPVVWRRDGLPAYHLTSVVDDDLWQVDLVIRGDDLRESTQIQRAISRLLPDSVFHQATVLHHPVITDTSGQKLSKSAGTRAAPVPRDFRVRERIEQLAQQFVTALRADLHQSHES